MAKMATMYSLESVSVFNETSYEALGILSYHGVYKSLHLIGLGLFYSMVKIGPIGFSIGKKGKIRLLRKFCSL